MNQLDVAGYRVLARLGQGGMARVFVACSEKQPGFTKLLVLKILKEDFGTDPEILDMFVQEARIAARLNHANVVQTYEVGKVDALPFIAMEYLEGQALSTVVRRLGKGFPLALQARALADALCGLHYAHELTEFDGTSMGIVHRDVSPQNVFLTYDGTVKIVDFGIAKIASAPSLTRAGVMKGKVGYMAPEQVTNKNVDRRADIFAIGVMLWEAIAGRRLVEPGVNEVAALQSRLSGSIPSLRELAPDAPDELIAIAEKALSLEPEGRYATAEEMQNAIEEHLRTASNPQGRDLGKLLREAFAEDRAKLKKTIEEQLAQPAPSVPIMPGAVGPSSFSPVSASSGGGGSSSRPREADSVEVTLIALDPTGPRRNAASGGGAKRFAVPLAAAAVFVIVAVALLRKGGDSGPSPSSSATGAAVASASGPATGAASPVPTEAKAAPKTAAVTLAVQPREAKATLDGASVSVTEPIVHAADGSRHELTLSAPGHKPVTREIVFDKDQTLAIDLAPLAAPAPVPRGVTAPRNGGATPTQPATTAASPTPTAPPGFGEVDKRKPRPIDTSSPF